MTQTTSMAISNFGSVRELRTKITELDATATLTGTFTVAKAIIDGKKKAVKEPLELDNAAVTEAKTQWFLVDQDGAQYWVRPLETEGNPTITLTYEEKPVEEAADEEFEAEDADENADDEFEADEDEEEDEE